jgi:hypothetical protein
MRPSDWLAVDDDVVATHSRQLFLSAGGHLPFITLLADALKRRRQHPLITRPLPAADLSALLGAYAGIMERRHRRSARTHDRPGDRQAAGGQRG